VLTNCIQYNLAYAKLISAAFELCCHGKLQGFREADVLHSKGVFCLHVSETAAWNYQLYNFIIYCCHGTIQYSLPWQHQFNSVLVMLSVLVVIIMVRLELLENHLYHLYHLDVFNRLEITIGKLCWHEWNINKLKKLNFYLAFQTLWCFTDCFQDYHVFDLLFLFSFARHVYVWGFKYTVSFSLVCYHFTFVLNETDPSSIHSLSSTAESKAFPVHSELSHWKSSGVKKEKSELLHLQHLTWHLWEYSIVHCVFFLRSSYSFNNNQEEGCAIQVTRHYHTQ